MRYKLYEKENWCSMGLCFLPVDNYLVFYMLNENNTIVSIIYGDRDVENN